MFGLASIISFAVFLFYSCLSRFLSLSMVHVFLSFLVYFPTFTSFFPPSPWNLIGLSPVLWRLRIRVSTAQTSSTLRNIEKEGNDKKEGAIGDWGWGPPVTRSRSMYYVIWGKVLVNSLPRCIHTQKRNYLTLLQQGENLIHLIDRPEPHCFRLHKDCAFYASESSMKPVARLGTCCGKFSKSGKSKLHVTSLDYLAQYAKYKGKHNLQMDCEMYHKEKNYLLRFE